MSRMAQVLLKLLALTTAVLFLAGAVLTSSTDLVGLALAASPTKDAGTTVDAGQVVDRTFFPATKSAPMPRPRPRDGGEPVYFPASKSFGGGGLPGVNPQLKQLNEPQPATQQAQQKAP